MQEELKKRCLKYAGYLAGVSGADCAVVDMETRSFAAEGTPCICSFCTSYKGMRLNTHCYGCSEAHRWNGKYIYYCPLGLVFAAASVTDETGALVGGLVAGPVIMGSLQDTLLELPCSETAAYLPELPVLEPAKVTGLSEILAAVAASLSGSPYRKGGAFFWEQDKFLSSIYDVRSKYSEGGPYPIESEKKLQALIRSRDKDGSRKLLNELLGEIFFVSQFDLEAIKVRVLELVVLISRATIDAGADVNEIFGFSGDYIRKIEHFTSIEELSVWVTGIMHRFIDYTFDFSRIKHIDAVYKAMEYVRANYDKKLSLDEIARSAYLSRAYLSSIFKEETGESLSAYINRVRIEKSKVLLMDKDVSLIDIANLCGFEDQSYFTRVFKKTVGVSPKKYRDSRGAAGEP